MKSSGLFNMNLPIVISLKNQYYLSVAFVKTMMGMDVYYKSVHDSQQCKDISLFGNRQIKKKKSCLKTTQKKVKKECLPGRIPVPLPESILTISLSPGSFHLLGPIVNAVNPMITVLFSKKSCIKQQILFAILIIVSTFVHDKIIKATGGS